MDPRLRSLSKKEEKQPMDSIPTLMGLNGLIYKVPMDSSLSVQRNLQTFNFDSTSYNNASPSMSVNFQAGSGYINCATSYVAFQLDVSSTTVDTEATQFGFGIGSASNLFRTNIVTTRSGSEVDRFQNANVLLPHIHRGKNPAEWFKSVGALAGYSPDVVEGKEDKYAVADSHDFVIPLSHFAGIFTSKQLMPSQLASGMRMDCQLEGILTALRAYKADGNGYEDPLLAYTISNPKLVLDVSILSDGALAQLTQQAGKNGLEYSFSTYANEASTTSSAAINVQFSRSVARALRCYVIPRETSELNKSAVDSFDTGTGVIDDGDTLVYDRVQFQIGSTYFPNREIQNNAQVYANLLQTLGQYSGHAYGALTKSDFVDNGFAVASTSFETSALIRASGTSVNNSRSLLINLTLANSKSRDVQSYLEYQVILRANLANVNVTS